jgi:DNA-binding GntR family transcriptional regulator
MNSHDWITIIAAATVVVGWFVNSALNRRHEIAKKRMEYRLDALHSFLPVFFALSENRAADPSFAQNLAAARTKFQLYCHKDEIDSYERLVATIEARNVEACRNALRDLVRLVSGRVRGELGLELYVNETR